MHFHWQIVLLVWSFVLFQDVASLLQKIRQISAKRGFAAVKTEPSSSPAEIWDLENSFLVEHFGVLTFPSVKGMCSYGPQAMEGVVVSK